MAASTGKWVSIQSGWRRYLLAVLRGTVGLALVSLLTVVMAAPALASVHTYHERPGQTTYRSQQSLRDQADRAWQATLFKRYREGKLQGTYLRLVGFPGSVVVDPERPLRVDTDAGRLWEAPNRLDPQTAQLPASVGQYAFDAVLVELTRALPLKLEVPLQGGAVARLTAAPFVVDEWRSLSTLGSLSAEN